MQEVTNTNGPYPPVQAEAEQESYELPHGTILSSHKRGTMQRRILYFGGYTATVETNGPNWRGVHLMGSGETFGLSQADLETILQHLREM